MGGVIFVGINQPGSNNNFQRNISASFPLPTDDNLAEWAARDLANVAWVNRAFDTAAADLTVKGIVIMNQANVFERFLESGHGYGRSGYENFVNMLRIRTITFGKPVVLVGGDTHTARVDKPLTTLYPGHCAAVSATCVLQTGATAPIALPTAGTRIQNFTRVEVFGQADIRVIVDTSDPNLFSFSFQNIPGNSHGREDRNDDDDL